MVSYKNGTFTYDLRQLQAPSLDINGMITLYDAEKTTLESRSGIFNSFAWVSAGWFSYYSFMMGPLSFLDQSCILSYSMFGMLTLYNSIKAINMRSSVSKICLCNDAISLVIQNKLGVREIIKIKDIKTEKFHEKNQVLQIKIGDKEVRNVTLEQIDKDSAQNFELLYAVCQDGISQVQILE